MKYLDRFFQPEDWLQASFVNDDGKNIRYGHAEPKGDKKGTVIITTGYADFIESYYETINDYLDRGYAVWMMDWAGHGGSDKKRTDDQKAQLIEHHVRDLHQFRHDIVRVDADQPVILSTHSVGGQVGLHYLARHQDDFSLAIMAAPLVDLGIKGMSRSILKGVFRAAVDMGMGNVVLKEARKSITRDAAAQRRKKLKGNAPRMDLHRTFLFMKEQIRAEDPTLGLVDSLFRAMEEINEEKTLRSIKTPVLLGIASEDDVVDNDAVRRAVGLLPHARLVEINGASHNLWHEQPSLRDHWWKTVDDFVGAFCPVRFTPPANDSAPFSNDRLRAGQSPKGPQP